MVACIFISNCALRFASVFLCLVTSVDWRDDQLVYFMQNLGYSIILNIWLFFQPTDDAAADHRRTYTLTDYLKSTLRTKNYNLRWISGKDLCVGGDFLCSCSF